MPHWLRNSLLALAALAVAGLALSWRPSIDAAMPPGRQAFAPGLIEQGARLAAVGNCVSCHTASPSSPFAGGRPMETPFGTVYSTNITPDAATGIGAWPEAAFARALREGVARDGSHLYPAFPYDHYTRLTDRDIHALYAYVMTREPVTAPARSNRLVFPLNFRPLLAGWKLLFLDRAPWTPVAGHDDSWNRGAYLSDALGHCSACHSPRNALGAEDRKRYLDGGDAEGWHATALNASSPSPLPWTVDKLAVYLRTGIAPGHAIAGGPMQEVVAGLAHADDADVRAIASYIHATLGADTPERQARAEKSSRMAQQPLAASAAAGTVPGAPADPAPATQMAQMALGAQVYAGACARCHDAGREIGSAGALPMPLAIANHVPDARNLLRIVRDGVHPGPNAPGRWMPAFGDTLTDEQLTAMAAWLRRQAAGAPPWPDLADTVRKTRTP